MNANNEATNVGPPAEWPEFLQALNRLYRLLGLQPDDAKAATFADAEAFSPRIVELVESV